MTVRIITGDCRAELAKLPAESVHMCVTSPPYLGLRDYGIDRQIGLEGTLDEYVETIVAVFREVRRVLRDDGTLWLNLGDGFAHGGNGSRHSAQWPKQSRNDHRVEHAKGQIGVRAKNLMMIPARVALALQADGWWIRSQMPWVKRSAMPESADDRPAAAIEYVFLLTKSGDTLFWQHRDGGAARVRPAPDYRWIHRDTDEEVDQAPEGWTPQNRGSWRRINLWRGRDYFFDMEAVRSEAKYPNGPNAPDKIKSPHGQGFTRRSEKQRGHGRRYAGFNDRWDRMSVEEQMAQGRNFRNSDLFYASLEAPHGMISGADGPLALDVTPRGFPGAHFATFPPSLIEPLIKAGTSERGCCAECGAPWVRQIDKDFVPQPDVSAEKAVREKHQHDASNRWSRSIRGSIDSRTSGWSPSCDCNIDPRPCTVLDPFGGAGTTGLVADRLGRDAVLIELNLEYAEMARRRIKDEAPLLAKVE